MKLGCIPLAFGIAISAHLCNSAMAWVGNINLVLGNKYMTEDWEGLGNRELDWNGELGEMSGMGQWQFDFRDDTWPFSLALDFVMSQDSEDNGTLFVPDEGFLPGALQGLRLRGVDIRATDGGFEVDGNMTSYILEVDLGLRKVFTVFNSLHPYVGGGGAYSNGRITLHIPGPDIQDRDEGWGYWAGGGAYWTLAEHWNVGFDVRYSKAKVNLFGRNRDAGGWHTGILFGARMP